jgi:hypothetical protein
MRDFITDFAQRVAALCLAILDHEESGIPQDIAEAATPLLKTCEQTIETINALNNLSEGDDDYDKI